MRGSRKLEPVLWNSVAYSVYKILYTILTTFLPQSKKVAFFTSFIQTTTKEGSKPHISNQLMQG